MLPCTHSESRHSDWSFYNGFTIVPFKIRYLFYFEQSVDVLDSVHSDGERPTEEEDDDENELRNTAASRHEPEVEEDIVEDEEVLKNIADDYFTCDESFDPQHYQLKVILLLWSDSNTCHKLVPAVLYLLSIIFLNSEITWWTGLCWD